MGKDTVKGVPQAGPAPHAASPCVDFRLADLLDCLGRWARSAQFCQGLNPAQWESLRFLDRANVPSRTPGALAKYLGTTRGTASQTVRALEKKGLVARVADRKDGRVVYLDLTDAGRTLLRSDPLLSLDKTLTDDMGPETAATINRHLGQVMACFQSAALGQNVGTCEYCGNNIGVDGDAPHCKLKADDYNRDDVIGLCVNFIPRAGADPTPD